MARKLKTYQTSLGFFDQAVAAPSMKAALEAWGAKSNLFHQGVAKEVEDPEIVAATMEKPGVILRRPVGSNGPFKEHADVPKNLSSSDRVRARPKKPRGAKLKKHRSSMIDDKAAHKAALEFEREQKQRESARRKEEAAEAKQRERRQAAIAKAQAAIEEAKQDHDKRANAIEAERAALEKRSQAEDARWEKQKEKLQRALRRAGG
jgi:hypothetical protein